MINSQLNLTYYEKLDTKNLVEVRGGGAREGDMFLSAAAGAANGIAMCAQFGLYIPWQGYAVCAVGGAASNLIWPR
ncbi:MULTISPECIES: Blp family class II bacteriocin [unclassified Streptococcus]|uniref:Blp family class II bacteriocin n=1 Tax=unclassified Streptococcus TaxID=2608887 RepID=UPI00107218BA|nr:MULTISPECIES: Blp family class II bacteriocin [unclassified Streptococcus]MBF0805429.1 Blp family class II bacteriocin [Streptococcus sp. 19428wA2_WM07]TFU29142.1 bacteriocin [Streptococcus sp. WM07]